MSSNQPNFPTVSKLPSEKAIDEKDLGPLLKQHKLSDDEYETAKTILGRVPSLSEMGIFSAMWSEHCSYKSSRVHLKRLPTTGEQVVVGPGENAGVVRLSGKLCAAFKMESHNHPSYIEPYQGAATGVGGILRDVFCMGARPVANLNCLRFGDRDHPKTGHLVEYVVKGIGDYGNCVGIPTVGGNVSYDPSYNGNCLVNAMTVGVIHEDRIFKGYASGVGNWVVYLGSATGRDGIHGATMASDSFASADEGERSTVQVGDPFTEKLLLEATLEVLDQDLVVGLQDMGAAGLTSSSFEMADRAGQGLLLDLDRVPTRAANMSAYELLLSESQERMLMVIEPKNWPALKKVLDKWQLASQVVGEVTDTGRVQIHFGGELVADVPVGPIASEAPKYDRPRKAALAQSVKGVPELLTWAEGQDEASLATRLIQEYGSNEPIYRQYDHHIGTKTVLSSHNGGAAVQWMRSEWVAPGEERVGLVTSAACDERLCSVDAKMGAAYSVLKAARMIAATGGTPLAITDCLNFGNPEVPEVMQQFSDAVDGIALACEQLNTPVVSGNVSLYNETDGQSIKPTPMIGMVGRIDDAFKAVGTHISAASTLYFVKPKNAGPRLQGSLLAKISRLDVQGALPSIDWQSEQLVMTALRDLVGKGVIHKARDVGAGGPYLTALKMVLPNQVGLHLDPGALDLPHIFSDYSSGYLVAVEPGQVGAFKKTWETLEGVDAIAIASATPDNRQIRFGDKVWQVDSLYDAFHSTHQHQAGPS